MTIVGVATGLVVGDQLAQAATCRRQRRACTRSERGISAAHNINAGGSARADEPPATYELPLARRTTADSPHGRSVPRWDQTRIWDPGD